MNERTINENETINVFVPTTPNPTSGYLLFVPRSELKYLEMSVEEAIKLVVSAGIITPPDPVEVAAKRKAVEAAKTAKAAKVAKPSKKEKPEKAARVKQDKK